MTFQKIALILTLCILLCSCKNEQKYTLVDNQQTSSKIEINWSLVQAHYLQNMTDAMSYLDSLAKFESDSPQAKKWFIKTRQAFKRAEPYASYLNPEVGHRANGPALPIVTDDTQKVLRPFGLQKIEESIYEGGESKEQYQKEIRLTHGLFKNLKKNIQKRELTPQRFFIATHQQLMRIISLGISGFDTPVSQLGLGETTISLQSLKEIYNSSIRSLVTAKNQKLDSTFHKNIDKAVNYLNANPNFETFDRFTFIRDFMNPITRNWVEIRKTADIWKPVNSKPFNFDAPTFFEEDSFNVEFFTPPVNRNPTEKRIALGKKLFFDANLSKSGKMACVTCHNPNKGWADGMVVNKDNIGKPLKRNTPTLINAAYQQSFFWEGRAPTILNQINAVFNNKKEFNSSVHEFSKEILVDSTYTELFKEAYGGIGTKNTTIVRAISSYIATLKGFNSKFDRNIRGEEDSFTEQEKLGFNLYMGKALCATCHFIPLTNGTVPPFFSEHEKEVIGVPETAANNELDDDLGFYLLPNSQLEVYKGMFKTPTVRNSEVTAPYMHNGVYNTLEEVMNFYNLGGGGGLGFDLPYQTLPFDNLQLTKQEEKALVVFMKTLTDVEIGEEY